MPDYSYLGKSVPRDRYKDKLTGKDLYAADFRLPGMLYGKILHSPYAHARILSIDTSKARGIPGVKAVITSSDTPGIKIGRWLQDRPVLADKEVRYVGEPVVAVAALEPEAAEEAIEAIRVEYEDLPAVYDALSAILPDAPLVHDRDALSPREYRGSGKGNIILEANIRHGDVEKGLSDSHIVYQNSYRTPAVHQGFIEPHTVFASPDESGKVAIWSTTKAPFIIRRMTAKALGLPLSRLRVIAPAIGGDFGGKGTAYIEPIAVLLALKSGLPVRLSLSRREELTSTFVREAAFIDLEMGADRDGNFIALKGRIVLDSGAYCDMGGSLDSALNYLAGPYNITNVELSGYRVYTNNLPRGNVRAPSAPHPAFAIESHIDGLAAKLGIDPIDVRLRNGVQNGDVLPGGGAVLTSVGLKPTLRAAADFLKRERGAREENKGWGVACSQWGLHKIDTKSGPTSSAWVKINEDGTVVLITGATENGGGQQAVFSQIVSEILKIPPETVVVVASDTDCTPYEQGTGGSRTTYRAGSSVRIAAEDAREKVLLLAAEKLKVPVGDLELQNGRVLHKDDRENSMSLAALAQASLTSRRGPIVGVGERLREEMLAVQAKAENEIDSSTHGTHVVQVEVEPETGRVKVLKYFAAHDVGFAINPDNVRGQIEGGVTFGLGYALSEELMLEKGRVLNADLVDYRLPVILDVPSVKSEIVEVPSRFGPFGAKGIGEPPAIPVAPAIANAIYDAVGVRITDLPITPEKLFNALQQSKK